MEFILLIIPLSVAVFVLSKIGIHFAQKQIEKKKVWKTAEGIVIDLIYKPSTVSAMYLSPYIVLRFLEKIEDVEEVITIEIPQPGDMVGMEAIPGYFVHLHYRWDANNRYQRVLETSIFSIGNYSQMDQETRAKLVQNRGYDQV